MEWGTPRAGSKFSSWGPDQKQNIPYIPDPQQLQVFLYGVEKPHPPFVLVVVLATRGGRGWLVRGVFGRRGNGDRREERVWPGGGANNPSRCCWWRDLMEREGENFFPEMSSLPAISTHTYLFPVIQLY